MKTNERMLAKNISKEYNRREVFINLLIKICKDFKIKNIKEKIVNLLKQCVKWCVNKRLRIQKGPER